MLFTSISNVSTSTASGLSSTTSTTTATTITTNTTTTTTSGFTFLLKPLASTWINTSVPVRANSIPLTSTVNSISTPLMTARNLEDMINDWNLEQEDSEKPFTLQPTQVNTWNCAPTENDQTIPVPGEAEKVKLNPRRLENELDFILTQQKELEDLLIPLEASVTHQSGFGYLQHTDAQREWIYKLAETIEAQLKHIAQDLKDIIEYLNTFGSTADTTESFQKICRILNGHMDALRRLVNIQECGSSNTKMPL
ncbi:nucleoporin-62 C-terminal-like protein [Echinops telfairi]|uniref:Nucleoporin-62 C-terminal-like protein n=1 Tax=Echinops telfairi TaxID=9371 RepID=A0AC55DRZ5_ECHTE|nr:nucleoporin-62 C-terminal-like protein [Echinops telfairi]